MPDGYTPHGGDIVWVGAGDSYTAGPGAGDAFDELPDPNDCYRTTGSYVVQLNQNFPFNTHNSYQFIACTGDKTPNFLDTQVDLIETDPAPDFLIMSLGGNDVGFSDIVRACLLKPEGPLAKDCDTTVQSSKDKMNSQDFQDQLFKVYDAVFDKMPANYHYQIYHLLYHRFFNVQDSDDWCNQQTFGIIPGYRPLLELPLRQKLNDLVDDLNSRIKFIVQKYYESKSPSNQPHAPGWFRNRIWSVDPEDQYDGRNYYGLFDGHRFCEQGVKDPNFADPSIWFFGWRTSDVTMVGASHFSGIDASSCANDPKYDTDMVFTYSCAYAQYFSSPQANQDTQVVLPEQVVKAFHPRSSGFTAIKNMASNALIDLRPAEHNHPACTSEAQNENTTALVDGNGPAPSQPSTCAGPTGTGTALPSSTSSTSSSAPTSTTWSDPFGPVASGNYSFYVEPRWHLVDTDKIANVSLFQSHSLVFTRPFFVVQY